MVRIYSGVFRCHYQILISFSFLAMTIVSCDEHKIKPVEKNSVQETLEVNSFEKDEFKNDLVGEKQQDTISNDKLEEIIFLKKNEVIASDFSLYNNIVFFKSYEVNDISYNLLKILYDTTIGKDYFVDPYINFLYVKEENKLVDYIVLYTIEAEDIDFSFKLGKYLFFEQYDSSTGWTKYFTFSKNLYKFIETGRLDEAESIIQSSIDLDNLSYQTSSDDANKKFSIVNQ